MLEKDENDIEIKINNININNEIKRSLFTSTIAAQNPIVIQLIEFGYDEVYSRRVFHYLHPEDLEEALNYMSLENGIIQHRFLQNNRNKNDKLCYICGEKKAIHLNELNIDKESGVGNHSKNYNEKKPENIKTKDDIKNSSRASISYKIIAKDVKPKKKK